MKLGLGFTLVQEMGVVTRIVARMTEEIVAV